jgi:hypothetical protein
VLVIRSATGIVEILAGLDERCRGLGRRGSVSVDAQEARVA